MTNEQVKADIAANLPDNTNRVITPAKLRTELGTMVDYSDTAVAAAVAGLGNGSPAGADATGINAGTAFIRLPYDRAIRATSRDGSRDISVAKMSNWPAIDGGYLDILIVGDERLECVSFCAPIDTVGNSIIDCTDVGNEFGSYTTRLVQKADSTQWGVGIASKGAGGEVLNRLMFDNLVAVATGKFTNCNLTVGLPVNLIVDSEFEGPSPVEWYGDGATGATIAGGHVGKCLQVTNGPGGASGLVYTTIPTAIGSSYTLTFWSRNGTAAHSKVMISAVGGGLIDQITGISDSVWTKHTITFTATSVQTIIILGVDDNTSGVTALFDSVVVMSVDGGGAVSAKQLIATEVLSLLGYTISFGANDSAGTGKRVLQVDNA